MENGHGAATGSVASELGLEATVEASREVAATDLQAAPFELAEERAAHAAAHFGDPSAGAISWLHLGRLHACSSSRCSMGPSLRIALPNPVRCASAWNNKGTCGDIGRAAGRPKRPLLHPFSSALV